MPNMLPPDEAAMTYYGSKAEEMLRLTANDRYLYWDGFQYVINGKEYAKGTSMSSKLTITYRLMSWQDVQISEKQTATPDKSSRAKWKWLTKLTGYGSSTEAVL